MRIYSTVQPIRLNDFHPGSTFLQYQLLEQIGSGGQGVVWSALDSLHQLIVAIKFNEVPTSDLENKDDRAFERQTDRLVELRHPHILPLTQYGRSGQIQYLVSPFMPGGTLQERLKLASFTPPDALDIATEIAAALDYLHARNVVHRDLKPGNVLLDLSQNAYVADFGLARILSATTEVLHTGRGTPPYAPPEQHTMSRMTPQSDIFSFGVMLYELFTGQLPWNGEKALGMQQLYSKDEIPDPREIIPELPPQLVKVLRAMTSADPASRPPSAGEAMRVILALFNRPQVVTAAGEASRDEAALRRIDAQLLLKHSLSGWSLTQGTALSLTKFALIDAAIRQTPLDGLPLVVLHFMLLHSLTYGYNDDIWWSQLASPSERLAVATAMLQRHIETVGARVVNHLTHDPELSGADRPIPKETTGSLLELAAKTDDPFLQELGLEALKSLIPASEDWRELAFSPEQDEALARLALAGNAQSGKAAELIGRLRSRRAVKIVLECSREERRNSALLAIQQARRRPSDPDPCPGSTGGIGRMDPAPPVCPSLEAAGSLWAGIPGFRPGLRIVCLLGLFVSLPRAPAGHGRDQCLDHDRDLPGSLLRVQPFLTRQIASRLWGKSALLDHASGRRGRRRGPIHRFVRL